MLIVAILLALLVGVSLGLLGGGGSILTVPILRYVLSPSGAPDALGAAVVAFEGSSAIVPVARSWQSLSGGQAATELVVDAERKCVEPGIDDPEFAPVLGYLARGDRGLAAESLGDLPLELLMDKMVNPFAAAAGAYVLVEALDDTSRAPRWRGWIENLATRFTWLPDGAILEGRALLATESPGAALDRFLQGFERGVPLFAEGVRMLLDGLLAFSPDDAAPTDGARLRAATDHVRHWSAWLDPRQCFTTLRVPLAVEEAMPHGAGA